MAQNCKHCTEQDRKNPTKPLLPAEIMHDLQRWSEDEVSIREKGKTGPQMPKKLQKANSMTKQKNRHRKSQHATTRNVQGG